MRRYPQESLKREMRITGLSIARPVQIMNCTGWYHGPPKHYKTCEQFVDKPGGLENYESITIPWHLCLPLNSDGGVTVKFCFTVDTGSID